MDGDCVVKYNKVTDTATGSVDLQRSATKISLALNVDEIVEQSVVVDGSLVNSHWRPDTKGMRVFLKGALAESTLDPNLDSKPAEGAFFDTASDKEYVFIENKEGVDGTPDNGNNPNGKIYPFLQDIPFYTYPHRWSEKPGDYATTYMTLQIPWQQVKLKEGSTEDNPEYEPVENASWRTCYYQVPVIAADSDPLQLVRNVAYHVYLHVGLLGSFIPDEPLLLEDLEYSAAEWGTVNMDVNIPDVRYLVVNQNDYTVNNENSITIPFYTSHETIVTDATMTFYRYNFDDVGNELPVTVNMTQNKESVDRTGATVFTAEFDNKTKTLSVTHDLDIYEAYNKANNRISFTQDDGPTKGKRNPQTRAIWDALVSPTNISYFRKKNNGTAANPIYEDEYSRVEFEITVQHKDMNDEGNNNFKEVIKITQYPGMYITTVQNYVEQNKTSFDYTGAQGNTIINGNYIGFTTHRDDDNKTPDVNEYRQGTLEKYPNNGPLTDYRGREYEAYDNNPSLRIPSGWMTSIGLSTGNLNFNPNMYLVTVTTLPKGTNYKIGDPRSKFINNNLGGSGGDVTAALPTTENTAAWTGQAYTYRYYTGTSATSTYNTRTLPVVGFSQQTAIEGGRRTLKYYYPTQEDEEHRMMIAPKFRICSSYAGTTWILNRELARRRAAAYQERGYAAGRWRLPTYGEVSFVMELAAQYKIPRLFGTNGSTWWYWCAQGLVTVPAKTASRGPSLAGETGAVIPYTYGDRNCQRARFVYDEWYWGEADLKANGTPGSTTPVYTFTWGDREINFGTDL